MEKISQESIFESRRELMISKNEGKPTKRLAHFIKPSKTSFKDPIFQLPSYSLSKPTPISEPKNWPLELNYAAWRFNFSDWKEWVDKMASTHKSTWEKVGIFELIMSSTYEIRKDCNLLFGLAEKWTPETNTFVFSWGEVTITLEDLMISGYSVLGSPVFRPLETEELKGIEEQLENARLEMARSSSKKATHSLWLRKFMDSGSEIEHEAFLALWLSRYIFPNVKDSVGNHVFSIAIRLARGIRIALAPAVLASIYRDLSLLRSKIVEFAMRGKKRDNDDFIRIIMWSPFQLVQIWAWERFVDLQPRPNYLNSDEPRLARWDKLNHRVKNVRLVLDSSKESFDWRPYCRDLENWNFVKFYGKNEMSVLVDSRLDEELKSFARCLIVSPLVGFGFIEWYFPHRVARQFGFDQDLPGCIDKHIDSPETAWREYCRPISDVQLYIPPRNFGADVTTRYAEWWELSMKSLQVAREGALEKQKSSTRSRKKLKSPIGSRKKQKSSKDKNEEGKLLSEIIVKSLKQKKDLKNLKKFKRVLKCSERVKDGVGISRSGLVGEDDDLSSFSKKRKISDIIKEDNGVSLPSTIPKMSSKDPLRKNSEDDSLALRVALKQSKISGMFPLGKKTTKEFAGSLKRKMNGKDALCLHSSSLKTSAKLGVTSKIGGEDAPEKLAFSLKMVDRDSDASGSLVCPSMTNASTLTSVKMQKLINSPVPPGFPSKLIRVEEAMDSSEDELTIAETVKSQNKRENVRHKESGNVENLSNKCPSHLKNYPRKCTLYEASDSVFKEDEMTVTEMCSSYKNPEVLEKRQGGHVLSIKPRSHSSSMVDSMTSSTEIVPDSGDENSSGQSSKCSLHEASDSILKEDGMTVTEMCNPYRNPEVLEKRQCGHVLSIKPKSHSSSMVDSIASSTEIVPDSEDENSSGQSPNLSLSAVIGSALESPQSEKVIAEEVAQFANVENKQVGRCQSSSTQIESHLFSAEGNDQLSGIDDASLVHSEKPDHRNSSFDCNGSKLYQECLETEARLSRVEEMISELKAAWSSLRK